MNLDDLENQVLQDARREMGPSDRDADRVRAAVVAQIGLFAMGSAVTISGTSAAATASAATATSVLVSAGVAKAVVVSVLAIGGTAAVWGSHHQSEDRPSGQAHAAPSAPASSAGETPRSIPAPAQAAMLEDTAPSKPATSALHVAEPSRPPARHGSAPRDAAQRLTEPDDSTERERLGEEVWLLKQADRALRSHEPEVALKQLNELAARAPNGTLMEEREAVRTLAQCITGQGEQTQRAAYRFLEQYPASVYATRIRVSCALAQTPSDGDPRARTLPEQERLP